MLHLISTLLLQRFEVSSCPHKLLKTKYVPLTLGSASPRAVMTRVMTGHASPNTVALTSAGVFQWLLFLRALVSVGF